MAFSFFLIERHLEDRISGRRVAVAIGKSNLGFEERTALQVVEALFQVGEILGQDEALRMFALRAIGKW